MRFLLPQLILIRFFTTPFSLKPLFFPPSTGIMYTNCLSYSSKVLCSLRHMSTGPKAPFSTPHVKDRSAVSFEKNMPQFVKKKAWEKTGEDKESYFKRKHAHHHVLQAPHRELTELKYKSFEEKNKRERQEIIRQREEYRQSKLKFRELKANPSVDYIFGTNSVLAALQGKKREKFGKLYIYNPKETNKVNELLSLAKELHIPITETSKQDLNQLTDNAVHNGVVLESRPLDIPNVKSMTSNFTESSFEVVSGDDLLQLNEKVGYHTNAYGKRYPFGLYLDEISDPHNVGAVLRSAYFLGVDFILFSERNCASLSPVVAKASSGALEFIDMFKVDKPLHFFDESKKHGWKFVSTVAPTDSRNKNKHVNPEAVSDLLQESPVILVVGSEGTGIRTNLINKSDFMVAISNGREMNACVDSLNVSVATALLISKILP
ncbi:uncharacterized protein C5L36_0D00320 [Pichia kudriavzevii]|uniref:rRNA methyltransferase 1, mitochondrial n=2 Tax=Pichia kudriavzevii TaxID=4909 RepID=A0A2U9R7H4_PICKU|nr:uncharacterized protein C5L36_0D00320 [Pichia kudriavzevii]AWU77293.1 hypothetical protein C5L36_0D00320 [Pichia kudriavzevii]